MNDYLTLESDANARGRIKFLSVSDSEESFNGILGLAPESESSGPLLVSQLYAQGKVSANEFSIQMAPNPPAGNPSLGSFITFGGLHQSLSALDDEWISHRIAGSFHWQAKFNQIKYDGKLIRP